MYHFLNSYFVIHESFVIRSITLLCTAKEAFVKQTAFTNILRTEVSSKLFYSVTNVFSPQILSTKPQSCSSFSFAYVRDTQRCQPLNNFRSETSNTTGNVEQIQVQLQDFW